MNDGEDDAGRLRRELRAAGVTGVEDFGRFVSNVAVLRPSAFDERAAMPTLLAALPSLSDPKVVAAVAGHLRRPWARPAAFTALLEAFVKWADLDHTAAWHLGDALGNAARPADVDVLVRLCATARYGMSRQMIVYALRRFKKSDAVPPTLRALLSDPSVGLHASSTLRHVIGNAAALPMVRSAADAATDPNLQRSLLREVRKGERATGG